MKYQTYDDGGTGGKIGGYDYYEDEGASYDAAESNGVLRVFLIIAAVVVALGLLKACVRIRRSASEKGSKKSKTSNSRSRSLSRSRSKRSGSRSRKESEYKLMEDDEQKKSGMGGRTRSNRSLSRGRSRSKSRTKSSSEMPAESPEKVSPVLV